MELTDGQHGGGQGRLWHSDILTVLDVWPKTGLSVRETREHNWLDNCPTDSEQPPVVLPFAIQRIDARRGDVRAALAELRQKLSPAGNVVSEAGRRRTIEV